MPTDQLLALITLAVAGSFTPGPNNTIATVTGANHGLRATLPHVLGVPFGFGSMLVAGSLGVAALLIAHPLLGAAIKWIGIAYLLYIAWLVARAGSLGERRLARPLTFWQSAAFQYANPKAWMLAAATAGTFMAGRVDALRTAIIVAVFALAAVLSLLLWGALGAALHDWLRHGQRLQWFNRAMGLLLAATALWMARS
ncbi:MAG: LysE family translocator [Burkholderiaceae bacterium]|jgi:threonine/homoserine/homoserine lactone efflux protein|nr:LysE family translocator [Burkholderiaceae bacterium]